MSTIVVVGSDRSGGPSIALSRGVISTRYLLDVGESESSRDDLLPEGDLLACREQGNERRLVMNCVDLPPRGRCAQPCDLCLNRPCMKSDGHNSDSRNGLCRCSLAERGQDCRQHPPRRPKFV